MRRISLKQLAEAAGVSMSTVDRALNGRETVSTTARARITEAALRIGHPAAFRLNQDIQNAQTLPTVRFGVVLHKQGQDFYKAFAEVLHRAVAEMPGVCGQLVLEFSSSQAPSEMARVLRSMSGRCDILAATAVNHAEVTSAVEYLLDNGVRVFSLLSDFAQGVRLGYIGLNNLKIGRTAGWITALRAREPGKLLLFVGGHRWHGHELREAGFRAYLQETAPHLEVMETVINLETRQLTYETTLAVLARQPDLRGIYVAGGGMEGAIAALRESRAPGELTMVVPALTPESRTGLADGVVTLVTDTPLEKLCRKLIRTMAAAVAAQGEVTEMGSIFLPPELHVSESI